MRRGITLLEVLVAAILLGVGLVGAINVMARCAANSGAVDDRSRALLFARSKMDEIMKEPTLTVGVEQGQGIDLTTNYDWTADIEQTSNTSLVSITVVATNRLSHLAVTLTTLRRPDLTAPTTTSTTDSTTTTGTTTGATPATGTGGN